MACSRRELLKQTGALTLLVPSAVFCLTGCSDPGGHESGSALENNDGVGLAELIRNGEVTPLELVDEVIRRIELRNADINAVLPDLFDVEKARRKARESVADPGPLAGVPFLLKNHIEYLDARIDFGSRLYSEARRKGATVYEKGSELVAVLEASGLIVTGVTNSPELALVDTTEPVLHGATRNPWNLAYTAGGSSGGAAAAVAAGIVPIAHGNDGAGSIRLPASHCGLVGLKPSRGRETGAGSAAAALDIDAELCLSRSVRDTAAFLSIAEKSENHDLEPVGFVRGPSGQRLRIATIADSLYGRPPHPEVQHAFNSTRDLCRELGHQVSEASLPVDGSEFMDAFIGLWAAATLRLEPLVTQWLGEETSPEEVLEPWTIGLMEMAKSRGKDAIILRAFQAFNKVSRQMELFFRDYDVLLSPVMRVPPFRLGVRDTTADFGLTLKGLLDEVSYSPLQNAVGMPGISVPLYWTPGGLPVGMQFSAWLGGERTLLQLAYQLEEARPWRKRFQRVAG